MLCSSINCCCVDAAAADNRSGKPRADEIHPARNRTLYFSLTHTRTNNFGSLEQSRTMADSVQHDQLSATSVTSENSASERIGASEQPVNTADSEFGNEETQDLVDYVEEPKEMEESREEEAQDAVESAEDDKYESEWSDTDEFDEGVDREEDETTAAMIAPNAIGQQEFEAFQKTCQDGVADLRVMGPRRPRDHDWSQEEEMQEGDDSRALVLFDQPKMSRFAKYVADTVQSPEIADVILQILVASQRAANQRMSDGVTQLSQALQLDIDQQRLLLVNQRSLFRTAIDKYDPERIEQSVTSAVDDKFSTLQRMLDSASELQVDWQGLVRAMEQMDAHRKDITNHCDAQVERIQNELQTLAQQRANLPSRGSKELDRQYWRSTTGALSYRSRYSKSAKRSSNDSRVLMDLVNRVNGQEEELAAMSKEHITLQGKFNAVSEENKELRNKTEALEARLEELERKEKDATNVSNQQIGVLKTISTKSKQEHENVFAVLYKHEHILRSNGMLSPLQPDGTSRPVQALFQLDEDKLQVPVERLGDGGWAPKPGAQPSPR
ncbi:hypothetical protein M409DRAFT_51525 [Zasmidium cellare ATCC 36951]|uniref:Uncharacterized protein n=1 Tax=Zasmidium cellare ATCC 36951 TaxID=1080233 RepID=A0A6A6CWA8_ZASCE|nr:uncharacterized protein M409DRAFT_51525 [Zasmidium cellare ATCC 36951]KAF2170488.1 hypothetical protein M409DRAFT_51525 [Zasmidium cellare ATCC 36951]